MRRNASNEIEAEVDRLRSMPIVELRARWRAMFKSEPPKAFGPDLLRRSLAQRIQENAYGGLSAATRRLLNQLIAQNAKTPGKIVLPRRIKAGAVLVRAWKGKSHRVMVLADGFAYEGQSYASLSQIARLITGGRWNGPRFFGLRQADRRDNAGKKVAATGKGPTKLGARTQRAKATSAKPSGASHGL